MYVLNKKSLISQTISEFLSVQEETGMKWCIIYPNSSYNSYVFLFDV